MISAAPDKTGGPQRMLSSSTVEEISSTGHLPKPLGRRADFASKPAKMKKQFIHRSECKPSPVRAVARRRAVDESRCSEL
jgi:hypothetical protein